jgi:hypothetical protein
MPAAAPISGVEVKVWPCSETRGAASGESRNAGSAEVVAVLRCEALGASMASGRVMPKSRSLTSTCSTVVIIVDPRGAEREYRISFAGDYRRANAAPRRFPPSGELARPGTGSKSVSPLLRMKPWPGTVIALPPVCSIV